MKRLYLSETDKKLAVYVEELPSILRLILL